VKKAGSRRRGCCYQGCGKPVVVSFLGRRRTAKGGVAQANGRYCADHEDLGCEALVDFLRDTKSVFA
jgi:hypothetical protein